MLTKDSAICIRTVDYSETSQVVTLFARAAGKIDAIAKGSKRLKSPFGGALEVFSYGEVVFSESSREKLAVLTEFEPAAGELGFARLSTNLVAMHCGWFAAELVNKLTDEYDPHPKLFDGFVQFLRDVQDSRNRADALALMILFQLLLLKEAGLQPVLSHCANCKTRYAIRDTQYEFYFSSSANGLICRDCEVSFADKIRLSAAAANAFTDFKKIADADEKTLTEIEKVLAAHFTDILGRPPKTAKFVLGT